MFGVLLEMFLDVGGDGMILCVEKKRGYPAGDLCVRAEEVRCWVSDGGIFRHLLSGGLMMKLDTCVEIPRQLLCQERKMMPRK